jgi:hypothetical protein
MEHEEGVCIFSGRDDCEGQLLYGPDPYEQDVNGDETPVWLCQRHADDQAMEI